MANTRKKRAIGIRGSWFATVDGERFPCFHQYYVKWPMHHSRNGDGGKKHRELIEAINCDPRIILTSDEVIGDGEAFKRTGYLGLFAIDEIKFDDEEIKFRIIAKLEELA